jgi:hypothetical protein
MKIRLILKKFLLALPFLLFAVCATGKDDSQPNDPKTLLINRCAKCHTLDRTYKNETAEYWTSTTKKMKSKIFSGISDDDAKVITQYLIETRTGAFKPENAEKN